MLLLLKNLLFTVVVRCMMIASDVYFADKLTRVNDLYGSLGIAIVMLLNLIARILQKMFAPKTDRR